MMRQALHETRDRISATRAGQEYRKHVQHCQVRAGRGTGNRCISCHVITRLLALTGDCQLTGSTRLIAGLLIVVSY